MAPASRPSPWGEEVAIRYSPAAPAKTAELPYALLEFRNWFIIIVSSLLGLATLVGGLEMLLER